MSDPKKEFLKKARPLAKGLIKHALTAGKQFGITDVRVSISSSDQQENAVEKGAVVKSVSGAQNQVSVTLYAGDRTLSFTKNTLDEKTLKEAIQQNLQVIRLVPENKDKRLLEKDKVCKGVPDDLDLYDGQQPDQQALIDYAKEVEAAAMAQPGVKGMRSVGITKSNSHFLVMATNGLDLSESSTVYAAHGAIIAEDASGMQINYESSIARHFSDMSSPQELGKNAGLGAVAKLGAILPLTGDMPVVLSPDAAKSFFASVYAAIKGTQVHRGTTFLKDKMGQQVMSKGVTIVDDPSIPRALGSGAIDMAGLEAKKITFIEDGVLKSFNVNLLESRQLGIEPIGRETGTTNSRVLPGTLTPEELISDIQDGIYITGFNGGAADVNNGNHSREAYGTLIKDGKVTNIAVDGFVISGNLKDMFMNVVLANDTPELPSPKHTLAAPTTRINGVTIAGK